MKNFFKKYRMSFDLLTVANIVIGIILTANPEFFTKFVSIILGIACLFWAATSLVRHFRAMRYGFRSKFDIIQAVIGISLSLLLFFGGKFLASVIPMIIGFTVITQSISKIQLAVFQKRAGAEKWLLGLVLNIIGLLLGFTLIFNPFSAFINVIRLLGIVLLINGVSRLFTDFLYAHEMDKVVGTDSEGNQIIDVEYKEL